MKCNGIIALNVCTVKDIYKFDKFQNVLKPQTENDLFSVMPRNQYHLFCYKALGRLDAFGMWS